ncbi:hypothetical protein D3C71_1408380 [compost metagenome]
MAVAQAGHFEPTDLAPRQVRHVDVEDGVGGQRVGLEPGDDLDRGAGGGVEVARLVVVRDQRHRHCGQAEEAPLHRRRDGTGVDDVVAKIGGVVDARYHHVRLVLEHAGQGQMHAVGRGAGHRAGVVVDALHADRQVQGQRIAGTGAITIRRDHGHFMTGVTQYRGEHLDARCIDTVVVADQNPHLRFNRLIFQDFDSITSHCWRRWPCPFRSMTTAQVRQLLCRKRTDRPTPITVGIALPDH